MNEAAAKARPRSIYRVADELCELYQQQIDTLRGGTLASLPEAEVTRYEDKRRQIADLQVELKTCGRAPS
jgi:hypothetical protein